MYRTVKATPYSCYRHNSLMTYSNSVKLKRVLKKGIRGTRETLRTFWKPKATDPNRFIGSILVPPPCFTAVATNVR